VSLANHATLCNQIKPERAAGADHRAFTLAPRQLETQRGGPFLFLSFLVHCDFPGLLRKAGYPGTRRIAPTQALLSLLALKLCSRERILLKCLPILDQFRR
jgi:hypothetical protein